MKKLYIFIVVCFPILLFGQGEANNWYFGQFAGVTFNTNPPTALTDGQLNTLEGCSTISDTSGNLLFYTDGRTVWDKEHNIMPNADYFNGTGLLGDPSSTSSGLIVPHPTDANLYYIFTVDEPHQENANAYPNQGPADEDGNPLPHYDEGSQFTIPEEDDGFNNGFNYSVVDMNLRNGLGDVIEDQWNIHLITYNEDDEEEIKYKCSEKISAVVNDNCNSIWVLTHFINRFYAFTVDENGVDPNPVISEIEPTIPLDSYRRGALGYLKASPDGNRLISANLQIENNNLPPFTGNVYVYDFDNATGIVENPTLLIDGVQAYGVEFSADSNKAYATTRSDLSSTDLSQWDLEAEDIQASQYSIENVSFQPAAIQLAPNGKIYHTQLSTSKLDVINFPNQVGAAMEYSSSFANGAIDLQGNQALFGLPPFIQSIFASRVGIVEESEDEEIETQIDLCEGDTYILSYEHNEAATYQWYENGELIDNETSSTLEIPIHPDATENLNYTLDVLPESGECKLTGIANVIVHPLPEIQNWTIDNCVRNIDDYSSIFNLLEIQEAVLLDANTIEEVNFTYFLTQEEAELFENPIQNPNAHVSTTNQALYVRVENEQTQCFSIAAISLIVSDYQTGNSFELLRCDEDLTGIQSFDLTEVETALGVEAMVFYPSINDALNQTNQLFNPQNHNNVETYLDHVYYRIEDGNCSTIGKIDLIVDNLPMLSDEIRFRYCIEHYPETISIQPNIPENEAHLYDYFWPATNETTFRININELGSYAVLVTEIETGCDAIQDIKVIGSNLATFDVITADATRNENSILIQIRAESLGEYEYALDNPQGPYQDEPFFNNLPPGFYTVYIREKNGCGTVKREVALLGIMPFFTPNNDGINDTWRLIGLDRGVKARIRIFDRFGKLLHEFDQSNTGWDGNYHGKPMLNNDYWYSIHLEDGRVLRGNFTLKR